MIVPRLEWFPDDPAKIVTPEWTEDASLGPAPAEKFVEVYWWLVSSHYVDVSFSSPSAVLKLENVEDHGVVCETRCFLLTKDPTKCVPKEIRVRLYCELVFDEEIQSAIPEAPRVSAVWPRTELTPPVRITRGFDSSGKLTAKLGTLGGELSGAAEYEEQFERFLPANVTTVNPPNRTPRQITFCARATEVFPSVEGDHLGSFWLTHRSRCFVKLWADVDVSAKIGRWGNCKLQTIRFTNPDVIELRERS